MSASGSIRVSGLLAWPKAPTLVPFVLDRGPHVGRVVQGTDGVTPGEVSFGPFRLSAAQFLLLEGDKPIPLGSRALEILIALLEHPGVLISKQELMARVWPNVFVGPANLTVHISALRRALRDGQDGNRFIINIPGRGYKFVGSVCAERHQKATANRKVPEREERQENQTESECRANNVHAFPSSRASVV